MAPKSRRMRKPRRFQPKTLERAKKLTRWYAKLEDMKRRDAMEAFLDAHPEEKKTRYQTLKNLMMQLSYASLPLSSGKFDMRRIPKSHRRAVKAFQEEFKKGSLNLKETRKACQKFLKHSINERIAEMPDMGDKNIRAMQDRFGNRMKEIASLITDSRGAHPARAYGIAWRIVGKEVHKSIPLTIKKSRNKEEQRELMTKLWHSNYLKADAVVQYERATLRVIDIHRNHLHEIQEDSIRENIITLYKDIDRYPFGKRKLAFPKERKKELVTFFKKLSQDIQIHPEKVEGEPYRQKLIELGRHLNAGDTNWHVAMKKRGEIGIEE